MHWKCGWAQPLAFLMQRGCTTRHPPGTPRSPVLFHIPFSSSVGSAGHSRLRPWSEQLQEERLLIACFAIC
ncbi:hypothetical protein BJX68DRAFT_236311 [Aspergillus pseudodeflectus]|uniref:Uncharacterized protein n=1 Tax=Aspergillus pseudodeflectus TaxID=176178 RepID=A0ABR4KEU2_9EURO